jgi:predicted nucleotidyltransferase
MFALLCELHGQWTAYHRTRQLPVEARREMVDAAIMGAVVEGNTLALEMLLDIQFASSTAT